MGEIQSERCGKKGMKQNKRKEDTNRKAKETKSYLLTRTQKREGLLLPPISVFHCQLTLFFHSSFCLCLSVLTPSCPLTLPCFLCLYVCVRVCVRARKSHGVLSGCQAQSCHTLTEPAHPSLALPLSLSLKHRLRVDSTGPQTELDMGSLQTQLLP